MDLNLKHPRPNDKYDCDVFCGNYTKIENAFNELEKKIKNVGAPSDEKIEDTVTDWLDENMGEQFVSFHSMNGCIVCNGETVVLTVGEDVEVGQVLKFKYDLSEGYRISKKVDFINTSNEVVEGTMSTGYEEATVTIEEKYATYTLTGCHFVAVPVGGSGDLDEHKNNADIHVTPEEKDRWNNGTSSSGSVSWDDIKDKPFGMVAVKNHYINETALGFGEGAENLYTAEVVSRLNSVFEDGKEYNVIWDGVEYTGLTPHTLNNSMGSLGTVIGGNATGNTYDTYDFSEYPFIVCVYYSKGYERYSSFIITNEEGSHDVEVYCVTKEVVTIPEEYLPVVDANTVLFYADGNEVTY